MKKIEFDENNEVCMTSEEVLEFIHKEKKVTVRLGNGFESGSDTEDVFRGLMSDETFENNEEMMDAMYCQCSVNQLFFLSNAKTETPFNEIGMVKRLIKDGFWTSLILHDYPIKDNLYAHVENKNNPLKVNEF